MISVEFFNFIDIFPAKTYNDIRDGKPSSGEFLPDSGKLYIQESSCQIVENFINQEIPCQTVGNFINQEIPCQTVGNFKIEG